MVLRPVQLRFDPEMYEFVAKQAASIGVSFGEYVRGAALARAMFTFTRSGDPAHVDQWDELYSVALEIVRSMPPPPKE